MNVQPQLVRQRVDNFVLFGRTRFRLKVMRLMIEVDPTKLLCSAKKESPNRAV
jgi:hypothetical protein